MEKRVAFYFALLGIGYLFPFSAMSQPVDYWRLLFDFDILFYISAVFMYTNLLLLMLLVCLHRNTTNRSLIGKIVGGFLGQWIALILVPSAYFLYLDSAWNTWIILGCTSWMALATAFLDSSVIALASCFPTWCQEALQLGVGLSTLIGCIYRVLTKMSFPQTDQGTVISSLVYFYTGAATILICLWCFWLLLRTPLAKQCFFNEYSALDIEATEPLLADDMEIVDDEPNTVDFSVPATAIQSGRTSIRSVDANHHQSKSGDACDEEVDDEKSVTLKLCQQTTNRPASTRTALQLIKHSLPHGLCITFLFMTTLAVWPALITVLTPHQVTVSNDWWALILLNLFAFLDVLGRFMVSYRMGVHAKNIWIPVGLRILLIPLLMGMVKGWWLVHDGWSILVVAVLGWTNGWCGSLTILLMNESVSRPEEKRFVGTFASFYLNIGLVLGATVGLLVEKFFL